MIILVYHLYIFFEWIVVLSFWTNFFFDMYDMNDMNDMIAVGLQAGMLF